MSGNIILSKITGEYIPVKIKSRTNDAMQLWSKIWPKETEYEIYDGRINIGHVYIADTNYGCYVQRIENKKPYEYGRFGYLADKTEVQYCLEKGMDTFEIRSQGALNSHALHYLRGKQFEGIATTDQIRTFQYMFPWAKLDSFDYNTIVKFIIDNTPKGEKFNTEFLGQIPMFMPQKVIQKYIKELIKNPIIIK